MNLVHQFSRAEDFLQRDHRLDLHFRRGEGIHCIEAEADEQERPEIGDAHSGRQQVHPPREQKAPEDDEEDPGDQAVRPAALVLVELEIWPNLVAEAKARGVPRLMGHRAGRESVR